MIDADFLLIQPFTYYSMQTLNTLNLESNQISDKGIEYLGNALLQNKVTSTQID
jgi:hypothetical protein